MKTPKNEDGTRNYGKCKCGKPGEKPAPCPYALDIYGEDEECNCCEDCRAQCCEEI